MVHQRTNQLYNLRGGFSGGLDCGIAYCVLRSLAFYAVRNTQYGYLVSEAGTPNCKFIFVANEPRLILLLSF